jgi:hypothetical protein
MYVLQILQLHPPAVAENAANQQAGWKGVATCRELEPLTPHVRDADRRIVDGESLDVVYSFQKRA